MIFNFHLQQIFKHNPEVVGNTEAEQAMFNSAFVKVTVRNSGSKVTGASCGPNPRNPQWTPEIKRYRDSVINPRREINLSQQQECSCIGPVNI